jgi:hypothetical protein
MAQLAAAQVHGIPPSVTSIQNHLPPYSPNIPPSVTSVGPYGYVGPPAFPAYPVDPMYPNPFSVSVWGGRGYGYGNGHGYGSGNGCGHRNGCGSRNGYGNSTGVYVVPYYAPIPDAPYGDDPGGGGPYVYSGPALDQTPHVVIDTPSVKRAAVADDDEDILPPPASKSNQVSNAVGAPAIKPSDPTVLVFRDGHRQEVSNYAIMGQTVYVFDSRRQKIALGDLDVPATIKANDDRGVEFQIPKAHKS